MFSFNLLLILLVDFHVYFGSLLSEKVYLKGPSEKKGTCDRKLWGLGRRPAPEGLHGLS